jgi:hypothetical protein
MMAFYIFIMQYIVQLNKKAEICELYGTAIATVASELTEGMYMLKCMKEERGRLIGAVVELRWRK